MAEIRIVIKPIKSKSEEVNLHDEIRRFVDRLNRIFGLIVDENTFPVYHGEK